MMMRLATRVAFACAVAALAVGTAASAQAVEASDITTASISGRVIDAQSGQGIPGIQVTPELSGGLSGGQPLRFDGLTVLTDSEGRYRIVNLPPGKWLISARDSANIYAGGWYPDVPPFGAECFYVWATPVQVFAGDATQGVNLRTPKLARFSCVVVDASSADSLFDELGNGPDVPMPLWRFDDRSGRWVHHSSLRSRLVDGSLYPGRYKIQLKPNSQRFAFGWYGGDTLGEASELALEPGSSVEVSLPLSPGNTVTGVIRAPDGVTPVASANVVAMVYDSVNQVWEDVRSTTTQSDGTYTISRLPVGPLHLGAEAPGYAFTFFGGSVTPGQSTVIVLDPIDTGSSAVKAAASAGHDITLARDGGAITGTASSTDWRMPTAISVDALAFDSASRTWKPVGGQAAAVSGGQYRLQLPPGGYRVRFRRSGSAPRYNGGAWSLASAPTIQVTAGGTVSGVDAVLVSGGVSTGSLVSKTVKYGSSAVVKVAVRDWVNSGPSGIPVVLERSTDGKTFSKVASGTTRSGGVSLAGVPTAKRTYFRWAFPGRIDKNPALTVGLSASVGTPKAPKTMSRKRSYSVYGYLKPRHRRGTYPVRIYLWRKNARGTWVSRGYVKAKAANYRGYTRYSRSLRLKEKGSWRIRAFAPEDSKHLSSWSSGFDYVKVK